MTLVILETMSFETDASGEPLEGSTTPTDDPQRDALRALVARGQAAERRLTAVEQAEEDLLWRWHQHQGEDAA